MGRVKFNCVAELGFSTIVLCELHREIFRQLFYALY